MREFSDLHYGKFNDEWADFFIELGQHTVENLNRNTRIIALVPTTKILPFLISIGAMNSFLKGNISTGFLPLESIWDELQSTPIGTEVHVGFNWSPTYQTDLNTTYDILKSVHRLHTRIFSGCRSGEFLFQSQWRHM